ncbi:hypothetical protein ACFVTE_11095 [Arthrobacter sp. NPDC058097]|uniref:hypothetical protein n=1 Tax=Arthrobacter sp. NPDC058097 TaxID=3346340 RepID=UPI0036DB5661
MSVVTPVAASRLVPIAAAAPATDGALPATASSRHTAGSTAADATMLLLCSTLPERSALDITDSFLPPASRNWPTKAVSSALVYFLIGVAVGVGVGVALGLSAAAGVEVAAADAVAVAAAPARREL